MECLLRTHEVRAERIDTLKRPTDSTLLQQQQQRVPPVAAKRARVEVGGEDKEGVISGIQGDAEVTETGAKNGEARESGNDGVDAGAMEADEMLCGGEAEPAVVHAHGEAQTGGHGKGKGSSAGAWKIQAAMMVSSCPAQQARGHTGYLTFARKWV